jgi:hypothetical protein
MVCWTILRTWRWRRYVPPKRRVQLNGLHGVISQKMILFITTAVKTSNPTWILSLAKRGVRRMEYCGVKASVMYNVIKFCEWKRKMALQFLDAKKSIIQITGLTIFECNTLLWFISYDTDCTCFLRCSLQNIWSFLYQYRSAQNLTRFHFTKCLPACANKPWSSVFQRLIFLNFVLFSVALRPCQKEAQELSRQFKSHDILYAKGS